MHRQSVGNERFQEKVSPSLLQKARDKKKKKLSDRAVNMKLDGRKKVTTLVSLTGTQKNNFHILGAIKCV